MDPNILRKLKQQQAAFNAAKSDPKTMSDGGFTNLPDGKYLAELSNAELGESKSSGRLQVSWEWTVTEGEQAGETTRDFDGLERADSFPFLLSKLRRLGVDIQSLDLPDLPEVLAKLVELRPQALIQLRTGKANEKGERYQNLYINEVRGYVNGEMPSVAADGSGAAADTSIGVGDKVSFTLDDDEITGLVRDFNSDGTVIVLAKGKQFTKAIDDLTLVAKREK